MKKHLFKAFMAIVLSLIIPASYSDLAYGKANDLKPCMVSISYGQVSMLTPDGTMLIAGDNEHGGIGNGEHGDYDEKTLDCLVLKPYAVMKDVSYISIQNISCYAVKKDNTLWSWGWDCRESLGNGREMWDTTLPNKILDDVKFVATGHGLHMLAIKNDNTLWGWGRNDSGEVGNGKREDVPRPVKVMSNIKYAAVGYGNSAVIKADDSLWVWGRNDHGELGIGSEESSMKPIKIMEGVKSVTMGFHRTCVLKKDGTLWIFGQNDHGEIGDGTTTERHKPVKVLNKVATITTKADGHMLALKKDGTVWAWGDNSNGGLGDGTRNDQYRPVKIMSDVQMVDCCYGNSVALKKDGTVWTWGLNNRGQLGTGDREDRLKPTKIVDLFKTTAGKNYTVPSYYLDGQLEDWSDTACIYLNAKEPNTPNHVVLRKIYAYMDNRNLYLAVKVSGKNPELHVQFDNNGDNMPEYRAEFSTDKKLIWTFKSTGKDKWKNGPELDSMYYDKNVYEIRIPLNVIGTPKHTSIGVGVLSEDRTYSATEGFLAVR